MKHLDHLMFYIFDQLLDDLWLPVAPPYRLAAANVAFNLSFITRLNPDDEPTLASRPRRNK